MDPTVAGALIGFGGGASISVATQYLGLKREDKQLRHSERLQIDTDARAVLDDALATAYEARANLAELNLALSALKDALQSAQRVVTDAPTERPGKEGATADDRREAAVALMHRLRMMSSRLTIRLGPNSPVTEAYGEIERHHGRATIIAGGINTNILRALLEREPEDPDAYTFDLMTKQEQATAKAIEDFAEQAHAWATRV